MSITNRDIDKLNANLQEWRGGVVSFNTFHDDHDRLILRLEHLASVKQSVGLALFYCSYIAGPIRWSDGNLESRVWLQPDGVIGLELVDKAAEFVVLCASASLYGEPGVTIPQS